jgi:hypothetical protein
MLVVALFTLNLPQTLPLILILTLALTLTRTLTLILILTLAKYPPDGAFKQNVAVLRPYFELVLGFETLNPPNHLAPSLGQNDHPLMTIPGHIIVRGGGGGKAHRPNHHTDFRVGTGIDVEDLGAYPREADAAVLGDSEAEAISHARAPRRE